jgi:hypothetical protein
MDKLNNRFLLIHKNCNLVYNISEMNQLNLYKITLFDHVRIKIYLKSEIITIYKQIMFYYVII